MPTTHSPWSPGTPCWVDYGAPDLEAAKAFYASILGWTYEGGGEEFGGYLSCVRNGLPAAGMSGMYDEGVPPRWNMYVASDDADASAAKVKQAGGTVVVEPMDVGPFGRMAIVVDPQGNPFGIWQAAEHIGYRIFNEPGSVVWNELATEDPAAAREFYAAVFGYRYDAVEGLAGYSTFATGDRPLGGLGGVGPGAPRGWTTCFSVESTDAAVETAGAGGAKVLMEPMDTPYGRFAVLTDPWGVAFTVMQTPPG
jgi:uncharacterized protein